MEQLGGIRGLLELAGLAMPQVVGGQVTRGKAGPFEPVSGSKLDVLVDPLGGRVRRKLNVFGF